MIDPQLASKVVLVTGANHGIGAATARAFAEQGAHVFLTFYREPCAYSQEELQTARVAAEFGAPLYRAMQQQTADHVIAEIRAGGGTAAAHELDLGDAASIPHLFGLCERSIGPVDILVNNHTYCASETFDPALAAEGGFPVRTPTAEVIDAHFAINARAYALLMAEYVRCYLQRGATSGRIINVSTDAAHAHVANISYAASKHAIESYSRSAAAEMGKYAITVNVVAPGPIQTGYITPQMAADVAIGTPLGRVGEPQDVADVIVFLASEQARWLTGQLLYVGGGWRIPM